MLGPTPKNALKWLSNLFNQKALPHYILRSHFAMINNDNQTDLFEGVHLENSTNNEELHQNSKSPRLVKAIRNQVEIRVGSIDEIIPRNHKARLVWAFVESFDLSKYLKN
jgi:hypothetical protein